MTPRILVVGDCMLDKFIRGEVKRLSPEAPVPVLLEESESVHLGGAANVAANARALGAQVELIGAIGGDAASNKIINMLGRAGIYWRGFRGALLKSTTKTRYCSSSHSGHHLLRVDTEEPNRLACSALVESQLGEIELKPYDAIIICDYRKGVVTQGVVDYIEKNFSKKVFFDGKPKSPKPPEHWAWKLNRAEAREQFGIMDTDALLLHMNDSESIITLGKDGITAIDDKYIHTLPALCKSPVDVSGAGDTTMAAYAVARTQGKSIPEALEFASKAAAVAVSQPGTAVVRLEDIQ